MNKDDYRFGFIMGLIAGAAIMWATVMLFDLNKEPPVPCVKPSADEQAKEIVKQLNAWTKSLEESKKAN